MTRPRRPDSVRFDPYYKVQIWDAISLAWRDFQRSFLTPAGARVHAEITFGATPNTYAQAWRIMVVSPEGRGPVDFEEVYP